MRDIIEAYRQLERVVLHGHRHTTALPYDEESPLADDLAAGGFSWDGPMTVSAARSRIRYLAALMPDASFEDLCRNITGVLADARDLTASDVRFILAGRRLDNGERTDEVDIERIQMVGKLLREGRAKTDIARLAGVSRDTVQAIDWYLGLTEKVRQDRIAAACDLLRDGVPVRKAAEKLGVSKSEAHRLLGRAREVLVELGEVAPC
jgi:hypothetical protein